MYIDKRWILPGVHEHGGGHGITRARETGRQRGDGRVSRDRAR